MRRGIAIAALVGALALWWARTGASIRIATFNIRNFRETEIQEAGAFEAIRESGASVVALQEIRDVERFAHATRERLGASWRVVWAEGCPDQQIGVLFDGAVVELVSAVTHRDTVVYDGAKPAFEARLRSRDGGDVVRVVVVHLEAGGDHAETRRRQLAGLAKVLRRAEGSDDRVVLLGDFNSTGDADRHAIAGLAGASGLEWVSEDLACTSYWMPEDACAASALDHVLVSDDADDAEALGPCQDVGCAPGNECPVWFRDVSDHCPVKVELADR